ncbi:MAG: hypothetical protein PHO01_11930 [Desulfotomaculaceae bacterium]|nr:hypothetical protein [Desulfotomaculaceae bacterium]
MKRTLLVATSGLLYFVVSLLIMLPLRTYPIPNYLLLLFPVLLALFLFLFYKMSTAADEARAYIYSFFSAIVLWQVAGELASIRVPAGAILQLSSVDIKLTGSYIYVALGWLLLFILWKSKAIPGRFRFFSLIFLGIWTFELYMENYSANIPINLMPVIANIFLAISLLSSIWIIYKSRKDTSVLQQIVLGGILYLTVSIILMSAGQWKQPQSYYLKYEKSNLEYQLNQMQNELDYINDLREQEGY